jgi:hypothetical protein
MTRRYHVTEVGSLGVFGHSVDTCDASGCSGDRMYLGGLDPAQHHVGDVCELLDEGCWRPHHETGQAVFVRWIAPDERGMRICDRCQRAFLDGANRLVADVPRICPTCEGGDA